MGHLIRDLTKRLSLKNYMPVQWFLYPATLSFMLSLSMPLKGFCIVFGLYRTVAWCNLDQLLNQCYNSKTGGD